MELARWYVRGIFSPPLSNTFLFDYRRTKIEWFEFEDKLTVLEYKYIFDTIYDVIIVAFFSIYEKSTFYFSMSMENRIDIEKILREFCSFVIPWNLWKFEQIRECTKLGDHGRGGHGRRETFVSTNYKVLNWSDRRAGPGLSV